jgi:hypothetical protein
MIILLALALIYNRGSRLSSPVSQIDILIRKPKYQKSDLVNGDLLINIFKIPKGDITW